MGGLNRKSFFSQRSTHAFTLVELLVVIGIMGLLMSLLMPALAKARVQANSVKCKSNLRGIGIALMIYMNENKGWLFPVGPNDSDGLPTTFGTNRPPNDRWPMHVAAFQMHAPDPLPFNPSDYDAGVYDYDHFPVAPFTPAILVCPSDQDPVEAHSYVLNQHLADKHIKFSSHDFGGLTSSQVIVAGEKRTSQHDYYMERDEFNRIVEKYQHGLKLGSNYLFFDGSVDIVPPQIALTGLDPWDLKKPDVPTTEPGS